MQLPLDTIVAFIILIMSYDTAPATALRGVFDPAAVVLLTIGLTLLPYFLGLLTSHCVIRTRDATGDTAAAIARSRLLDVYAKVFILCCFAFEVLVLGWPSPVESLLPGSGSWLAARAFFGIIPFIASLVLLWAAGHRANVVLTGSTWDRREYVMHNVRYSLFIIVPFAVLFVLEDLIFFAARQPGFDALARYGDAAATVLFLLFSATLFPVFLRYFWKCTKMPDGPLRRRLEELCRRTNIKVRDILVWEMGRGRILNAGVIGFVYPFRYVMFSRPLLDSLTEEECVAVLGHEIGHIKHRHMFLYLLMAFFTMLPGFEILTRLTQLLAVTGASGFVLMVFTILGMIGVVVLFWRYIFGFISRKFERQSDVAALDLTGEPYALMSSLEKIGYLSGRVRSNKAWRHFSIARRVAFLRRMAADPEGPREYHAHVRRVVLGYFTMVALLSAVIWLFSPSTTAKRASECNNRAWRAATLPENKGKPEELRRALWDARRAVALTKGMHLWYVDTLAKCYFENKNYKKAFDIQESLVKLLEESGLEKTDIREYRSRLGQYRKRLEEYERLKGE